MKIKQYLQKVINYYESTHIWDWTPENSNQVFELEKSEKNGFYLIKNNTSRFYMGFENGCIRMRKKGENNQNFKFINKKNGFYIIENEDGYVIDLGNWQTHNGNVVGYCGKNESGSQQWKLVLI